MQKSKITIGEEYAVWIDGLNPPLDEYPSGYGDSVKTPHGVIFQGVPPEHKRGRWAAERYIVRAKVVAVDQPRVTSSSYGRYYSTLTDGVVVKFHKPVEAGYYASDKTKLASATVTTKHILEPWADYVADQQAEKDAEAEQRREADRRAEEFAPILERTLTVLRERFEKVYVHEDNSGIEFHDGDFVRSGSIPLNTRDGTKQRRLAVGFSGDTHVNTGVLLHLLGIEYQEED